MFEQTRVLVCSGRFPAGGVGAVSVSWDSCSLTGAKKVHTASPVCVCVFFFRLASCLRLVRSGVDPRSCPLGEGVTCLGSFVCFRYVFGEQRHHRQVRDDAFARSDGERKELPDGCSRRESDTVPCLVPPWGAAFFRALTRRSPLQRCRLSSRYTMLDTMLDTVCLVYLGVNRTGIWVPLQLGLEERGHGVGRSCTGDSSRSSPF